MHSTYFRNFAVTAAMVLVSFLLIGLSFGVVSRNVFVSDTRDSVMNSSQRITHLAEAVAEEGDLRSLEMRMVLSTVGSSTGQHIFICTGDGQVVSCSDTEPFCRHMGMQVSPETLSLLPENEGTMFRGTLGDFYGDEYYIVANPLRGEGGALMGYLFVSRASRDALNVWETILPLFFLISLVVLMIALMFTMVSSRMMAQPLKNMAQAARRFGSGDLSARVEVTGSTDEIGELEEAFNTMADSLERSEERRREFIANVSHELKTPMTTIAGFADGILDGTIPPQSQARYLQTISSETKRLSRLVRSMLELSRLQAGDRTELLKKSFDISEILRLTIINFADKIDSRGLDVDFRVPDEPMYVLGDPDAITQVVYNLLDNAVKFSKSGTELGLSLWKDSVKAYVSVRNHGSTIPEAEIPLLFDRFHKSDRSRSQDRDGVGLGLHIVKTILTNHGEDVAVTSREGVTEFVFTLSLKQ